MPTLDKYAPYILAAYAVAIVALAGLIAWTAWRTVSARKKLKAAEAGEQREIQP